MHNNLRITRILKSLGELGFEHYQAPLVRFFLEETLVKKNLSSVKRSVLDYFLFAVRDKRERRKLLRFAYQHYEPKDKFVWCPRRIQKRFKKKSEKRQEPSSVMGNGDGLTSAEEGRSKGKAKDGDSASSGPKESKQMEEAAADTQSQMEEDSTMNVDPERPSEVSPGESAAVDALSPGSPALPNGNKSSGEENGEMEHSSSSPDVSPGKHEEDAGKDDEEPPKDSGELKEATKEAENSGANTQEMASQPSEPEKTLKKKRESDAVTSGNGVAAAAAAAEPPSSVRKAKSPSEGPTDSQASQGASSLGEASPAKRVGRTVDERAEKQPRTDFSSTPGTTTTTTDNEVTSSKTTENTADNEPANEQVNHQVNGTELRNNEEPMDVETSASLDIQKS